MAVVGGGAVFAEVVFVEDVLGEGLAKKVLLLLLHLKSKHIQCLLSKQ